MTRKMLNGIRVCVKRRSSPRRVSPVTAPSDPPARESLAPGVYLYWLPLGAGAHVVRLSGRAFEAITARRLHRRPRDLYHSALEVVTSDARFVIEMTPIPAHAEHDRGVVAEGAVGSRWARPFRVFRYEVRRWRNGVIADAACAIASPVKVSADPTVAQRVLELAVSIPAPVWGRDELHAGEMWNSNSVTSWLLSRGGIDMNQASPPCHGRAPGWDAGRVVAGRVDPEQTRSPPMVTVAA